MTRPRPTGLYALCVFLLVLPALLAGFETPYWLVVQLTGLTLLVVLTLRSSQTRPTQDTLVIDISPTSAVSLLGISNGAHWISFLLWRWDISSKVFDGPQQSIDPYVGPLIIWLFALVLFSLYEIPVILRPLFHAGLANKKWTLLGLLGLFIQFGTLYYIYGLFAGI